MGISDQVNLGGIGYCELEIDMNKEDWSLKSMKQQYKWHDSVIINEDRN
jgi:hypothetical protein